MRSGRVLGSAALGGLPIRERGAEVPRIFRIDMALPAFMRFSGRREVEETLRNGRRFSTPLGRIVVAASPLTRSRILFVVSRAVSKRSSVRNRLKRRLDEWAREERGKFVAGRNAVVFVSRFSASLPPTELRRLAGAALARTPAFKV